MRPHKISTVAEKEADAYAQLGFPDAAEMLVKAQLVTKIAEIPCKRGWSQQQGAKILGLTQPKLSKMLRGKFRGISEMQMMDCLVREGSPVRVTVRLTGKTIDKNSQVADALRPGRNH